MYSEYYIDTANANIPSWRMVRTATAKYIQTYNATGCGHRAASTTTSPTTPPRTPTCSGDANTANDPPAATITNLAPAERIRHLHRGSLRPVGHHP